MILGRFLGWVLIAVAVLMASADAVLALGPGDHVGILASDLWTLFSGRILSPETTQPSFGAMLLHLPAWIAVGPLGMLLILGFRPRAQKRRVRISRFS